MGKSWMEQAGFSVDVATTLTDAFDLAHKNKYAILWIEDSADRDMGSNIENLLLNMNAINPNIFAIGHNLTRNKWLIQTNLINRSFHDGDWYNTLRGVYSQIKNAL